MHVYVDAPYLVWGRPYLAPATCVDLRATVDREGAARLYNASLVVLSALDTRGESSAKLVARIRKDQQRVPIYICIPPEHPPGDLPMQTAWAGADAVYVLATESDWRGLATSVERRIRCPVPDLFLRSLEAALPPSDARTVLLWSLRSGWMQAGQRAAGDFFGHDIKTINGMLRKIGFPPVGSLFRYSLLMHAAWLQTRRMPSSQIRLAISVSDNRALWRKRRTARRQARASVPGTLHLEVLLGQMERARCDTTAVLPKNGIAPFAEKLQVIPTPETTT